ncbi:glycosyltransferase family 8 protein [Rhizobium leguminosarum]|uniref:glycosyltransferase family 8 protein n=1 Tax=Rhizobium leguminosarum TaxID=384 RepID=UPI0016199FFF|nr:glycosyltransferase family 8 protein [Rhizobium leguminosarum]MBB4342980.1 lipopolysaccharide biosynthesis glycosyltransferase [Rhizobium leguminosarum]MBB6296058.1 lipopolysaccharide biosynthesis glycosyltransferase [Rhizobium leguminosarum]
MFHIALAFDDNYAVPAQVLVESILFEHKDFSQKFKFWVFCAGDVASSNVASLKRQLENRASYHIFDNVSDHDKLETSSIASLGRISKATHIRIFMDDYLPKDIQKFLYLDCDIICLGSLDDLFATDLRRLAVGAVQDAYLQNFIDGFHQGMPGIDDYLEIDPRSSYFNSGVLLINRAVWQQAGIKDRALEYLASLKGKIRLPNQDSLNVAAYKSWMSLSARWNYMQPWRLEPRFGGVLSDAALVHFISQNKVWLDTYSDGELKRIYHQYLRTIDVFRR